MNEVKDVLLRLIRSWGRLNRMAEAYRAADLKCDALCIARDEIGEAICIIVGEENENWEESVTNTALNAPILSEDRRLKMLMAKYRETHPEQPAPHLFSLDEMKELFERFGGYGNEKVNAVGINA